MDHMPWLLERSAANGGRDPSGHALMASCPPQPFPKLTPDIPFGVQPTNAPVSAHQQPASNTLSSHTGPGANRNFSRHGAALPSDRLPASSMTGTGSSGQVTQTAMDVDGAPPRTWELSKADLNTLLDLSQKLPNADGEITPIEAWGMVLSHPRLGQLNEADFRELSEVLRSKVRCYG